MMKKHALSFLLALSLGPLAASCGSPAAPDAFSLALQLEGVIPEAVDVIRIRFTPQPGPTGMTPRFEPITDPTLASWEDGQITLEVDATDGTLLMTITGIYAREHFTMPGAADQPRLSLEVWSDDDAMRGAPQVRATVIRGSEQIADGAGYLPGWPLRSGDASQITVSCRMSSIPQCTTPP